MKVIYILTIMTFATNCIGQSKFEQFMNGVNALTHQLWLTNEAPCLTSLEIVELIGIPHKEYTTAGIMILEYTAISDRNQRTQSIETLTWYLNAKTLKGIRYKYKREFTNYHYRHSNQNNTYDCKH